MIRDLPAKDKRLLAVVAALIAFAAILFFFLPV